MAFEGPGRSSGPSMSQINVTPLVDVMLVLLVIFMVTAPIIQQGVSVDLPTVEAGPLAGESKSILTWLGPALWSAVTAKVFGSRMSAALAGVAVAARSKTAVASAILITDRMIILFLLPS